MAYTQQIAERLNTGGDQDTNVVDNKAKRLKEAMQQATQEILPKVTKANKPWISAHTLDMARQKRELK